MAHAASASISQPLLEGWNRDTRRTSVLNEVCVLAFRSALPDQLGLSAGSATIVDVSLGLNGFSLQECDWSTANPCTRFVGTLALSATCPVALCVSSISLSLCAGLRLRFLVPIYVVRVRWARLSFKHVAPSLGVVAPRAETWASLCGMHLGLVFCLRIIVAVLMVARWAVLGA